MKRKKLIEDVRRSDDDDDDVFTGEDVRLILIIGIVMSREI